MNWPLLVIGLYVGGVANAVWYYKWMYYKIGGKYITTFLGIPLYWFEHYHWATVLFIAGFRLKMPILVGVATVWLLDECVGQQHKFSLGSHHEVESAIIEALIICLWILVEVVSAAPIIKG